MLHCTAVYAKTISNLRHRARVIMTFQQPAYTQGFPCSTRDNRLWLTITHAKH